MTALTACGGSSGAIDESAGDAVKQASVALADLGPGWTEFRRAGGLLESSAESCVTDFGSPLQGSDHFYAGPMFRDASGKAFVYSAGYVFRTEAVAKEFTATRNTRDFVKCKEQSDSEAQHKRDPHSVVRLAMSTDATVGSGGLEAYYTQEAVSTPAGGAAVVNATYARYTYRFGRVVSVISVDIGSASDAASAQVLQLLLTKTVKDAATAIQSRSRVSALQL